MPVAPPEPEPPRAQFVIVALVVAVGLAGMVLAGLLYFGP